MTVRAPRLGLSPGAAIAPSAATAGALAARAGGGARYGEVDAGIRGGGPAVPSTAGFGSGSRWSSDQLFGDRQEVEIVHGNSVYRLRITSLGKLILTK